VNCPLPETHGKARHQFALVGVDVGPVGYGNDPADVKDHCGDESSPSALVVYVFVSSLQLW
jgi:hypothetical protein